jgi:hypothetical protein
MAIGVRDDQTALREADRFQAFTCGGGVGGDLDFEHVERADAFLDRADLAADDRVHREPRPRRLGKYHPIDELVIPLLGVGRPENGSGVRGEAFGEQTDREVRRRGVRQRRDHVRALGVGLGEYRRSGGVALDNGREVLVGEARRAVTAALDNDDLVAAIGERTRYL